MAFKNWQIWLTLGILVLFVYATKAILLPFLLGLAIAYFLDPVADKVEGWGVPRLLATVIVLILFFLIISGIILAIFPLVKSQLSAFINALPGYFAAARPIFSDFWVWLTETFDFGADLANENILEEASKTALSKLGDILAGFWSGGKAVFNLLTLLLITPVAAFYLLKDWDLLVAKINGLLPKDNAKLIRAIARDVDDALGGFVRGQTLAAFVMAIIYSAGWSIAGLEYALVLGLIGGIMAYIPVVGAVFTLLLGLLVGVGQFGLDFWPLASVVAVYIVAQGVEAAWLTPRLVGGHIRLHPVWVLFAIFAGGEMMGFTGILIAVPAAAVIGVLVRFYVDAYRKSGFHTGKKAKAVKKAISKK